MKSCCFDFQLISIHRTELMGVAILGVMIGHLMNHTIQPALLGFLVRLVHTPGFLFLSGFGLYYSFCKDSFLPRFYAKRISRLYIPFIIITSPFFLYLLFTGKIPFINFLGFLTTIGYWFVGNYYAMWYVAVSMVLYMLFPLLYKVIIPQESEDNCLITIQRVSIIVFFLLMLFYIIDNYCHEYWKLIQLGVPKTIMFTLGALAGHISKHNIIMSQRSLFLYFLGCSLLLILSRVLCSYNYSTFRALLGIPLACLFLEFISRKKVTSLLRPLFFFGRYSLELYLLHVTAYFFLAETTNLSLGFCMFLGIVFSIFACQRVHIIISQIQKHIVS